MIHLIWSGLYGLVAGVLLQQWLRTRRYRYDDEQALPLRRVGWVAPVTVVSSILVALGQSRESVPMAVVLTLFVPVFVALAAIDLDTRRLPDLITLPAAGVALVAVAVVALALGNSTPLTRGVLAALMLSAFYLFGSLVGGMGMGDVKYGLSLGLLLGALSWTHVIAATIVCFLVAGFQALYMLIVLRAGRKSHLAFGPYMSLGALVVLAAPALGALPNLPGGA